MTEPSTPAGELARVNAFLEALNRWMEFCRRNEGLTPCRMADSEMFPEDATEAREILAALDDHAKATLAVVVRYEEDYKLIRWWIETQRENVFDRKTVAYWEEVRLAVEHAKAKAEAAQRSLSDDWITYAEAAKALACDPSMICKYAKQGRLRTNDLRGKKIRVARASVGLLKLELDRRGVRRGGHGARGGDDADPPMAKNPGRPTLDQVVERIQREKKK